ncbi:MAG: B12-binding domain-containing radical SAM protein [Thermodesulfobacteriota bacterium]
MKVLLIFPPMPLSFFSYPKLVHHLGCKALLPPLGLITVAALLPREWRLRLVDLNVEPVTEEAWDWADLVMLSGMVIQRQGLLALIREAKSRGKTVVVGGPYANSLPEEVLEAGADFLVLGEGEDVIPLFLEALAQGQRGGVIKCDSRPDLTASPIPRFDLLNFRNYLNLSIQASRGCPHDCEFCDVVQLYGRRPRYKEPRQITAELETLFCLGWRGPIFVCDDNFIGNKTHARAILREVTRWSKSRGEPFIFMTQTTVDLGQDVALIDQMTEANFVEVFIGIESPEEEALIRSHKHHNYRIAMEESIETIKANGLSIIGSVILGMDGEQPGTGERIISFIERTSIPLVMVNLLQPAPHTRLWQRLQQEGRLLKMENATKPDSIGGQQSFLTSRPREQIMAEYHQVWETIYEPSRYLERSYRYFLGMRPSRAALARRQGKSLPPAAVSPGKIPLRQKLWNFYIFLKFSWQLGLVSSTRRQYWRHLLGLAKKNPCRLQGYFVSCSRGEDMFHLRDVLRQLRQEASGQRLT